MVKSVVLRGSVSYREVGKIVIGWLSDYSDIEILREAFGGVLSKSRTAKGVLYSLFVPEYRVKFLYLRRGEGDGK